MSEPHTVVPLKGVRGMTADHMVKSLATAAQLTHHASADASQLINKKQSFANAGFKVSIEDILIYATVRSIEKHRHTNGRLEEQKISLFDSIDLSIAVSLPGNLLVAPAIFGAEKMDVLQISKARRDLAERARSNKVSVKEMTRGTFTVSNLGLTRVEHFTPIINLPQICILGVGCMTNRPIPGTDGGVDFHPFINLSLTFDHRALDGFPAGLFLTTICDEIESASDIALPK